MEATIALAQGGYFLITGVWPLLSIRTFMAVTGPKTDLWLVKTVGAILSVIGAVLIAAGARSTVAPELALLATASAVALAAVDVICAAKRVIAPVYLPDAAVEAALVVWLGAALPH